MLASFVPIKAVIGQFSSKWPGPSGRTVIRSKLGLLIVGGTWLRIYVWLQKPRLN